MTTLADIRAQIPAGTNFTVFTEGTTPVGTFIAATRVKDIFTAYLFNGTVGDTSAALLGRVEAGNIDQVSYTDSQNLQRVSFRGGDLDGGERVATTTDWRKAFASIVA